MEWLVCPDWRHLTLRIGQNKKRKIVPIVGSFLTLNIKSPSIMILTLNVLSCKQASAFGSCNQILFERQNWGSYSVHQVQASVAVLQNYFRSVIYWVKAMFPTYRTSIKGRNRGNMNDRFKDHKLDSNELEKRVTKLILVDETAFESSVYRYYHSRIEKLLKIRVFTDSMKEAQ